MDVVAVFNADGTLRWAVKLENGDESSETMVSELAISPDGSVIAGLYVGSGAEGAEALVWSSDGSVISAALTKDPDIDETAGLLVKWDSEGVLEWVRQIPPIYGSSPLFVRDDETIVLMDKYMDGVAFDPGGPGETVIDHGECDQQFCSFAVEIAPDASSFTPHFLEVGGSRIAMRSDGSFALADYGGSVMAYSADYELEWTATIQAEAYGGVWIHDIAALADGSVVVTGDYSYGATFGAGEPNETTLHGVCNECKYGAFLARYAW